MKKVKFKLNSISVKSFVTELNSDILNLLKAGNPADNADCPTHTGSGKDTCIATGFPTFNTELCITSDEDRLN